MNGHRILVDYLDRVDWSEQKACLLRLGIGVQDSLDIDTDSLGVERQSVVEDCVTAKSKSLGQPVFTDLPRLSQARYELLASLLL